MPSNPDGSFSVSYDGATKIVTLALLAVLLVVLAVTRSVFVGCLCLAVDVMGYAYSPRGYAIRDGAIVVKRLIGDVRIPLDAVREVRAAAKDDVQGCIRLWGSGGFFGYYGLFSTSKLGRATWYVTNRSRAVVVVTGAKTALFSPDDVAGFVAAIQPSVIPGAVPVAPHELRRSGGLGRKIAMVLSGIVGVTGLAFGTFCVLYSPGFPRYTLTPSALTIRDFFYPLKVDRGSVDVDRVRLVNTDVDTDWQPIGKTNGFANSHYESGWFRVANGQKVRMYRQAHGQRLVLLPPKGGGAAILLEIKQPEKFIDEVRREWALE